MSDTDRALVAYRYSVPDIDRWPDHLVEVFARHLRKETTQ
jgi:hypothetical protein